MATNQDLTQEQLTAIKRAALAGRRIQKDHPEVTEKWKGGKYLNEIITEEDLDGEYNLTIEVARHALGYALRGYNGGLGVDSYDGLIPVEEFEQISKEHQSTNLEEIHGWLARAPFQERSRIGRLGGSSSYRRGAGIHKLDSKGKSKAGKKGGLSLKNKGMGIFAQTEEERREASLRGVKALGHIAWVEEKSTEDFYCFSEKEYAYRLSQSPDFQHPSGANQGRPKYQNIAEVLNRLYHNGKTIRNARSVNSTLFLYIRDKKSREQ